ncbi:MAG: phosphoribosyl-ATP diphosphatase [Gammaproteobacteria bacterium]|nr:phosphoribosyl-ATP diphosphatase [Gammaproteobacteria bacterium]
MSNNDTLHKLAEILEQRKNAKADESYVASLYESGLEKILAKINEEASETIEAAREADTEHLIHEVADLWFHCMVLLAQQNLSHENVLEELNHRFGISGLVEKAQR